jgi:hypothetical protein
VAGYEDDGKIRQGLGKRLLKRGSVDARHTHIGHSAIDLPATGTVEELARRRKRENFNPSAFDKARNEVRADLSSSIMATLSGVIIVPSLLESVVTCDTWFNRQREFHRRSAV